MEPVPLSRDGEDFEQLLDRARSGCQESLGKLLETCRKYLLHAGKHQIDSSLSPKGAASDLVQDTMLEAMRDFPQFRGKSRKEFLVWIFRMLQNNMRNFQRSFEAGTKRQIKVEVRLDDTCETGDLKQCLIAGTRSPSSEAVHHEEEALIRRAVNELPEHYRSVLRMRTLQHLPFEQIAAQLGSSTQNVRQIWHRAMRQLAHAMKDST